jgi:hypothetical protein
MDMKASEQRDHVLRGLKVLVMLPPGTKEHTMRLVRIVETAKARWDWRVDAICLPNDRHVFKSLVAGGGKIFTRPRMLEIANWESDPARSATVDRNLKVAELATGVSAGQLVLGGEFGIGRGFVHSARILSRSPLAVRVLKNNQEPFRVIRRLFAAADEAVAESNPDLVLASEWATPAHSTVWLAAASQDIPCICIRRSKIRSDYCFWTADRLMLNAAARDSAVAKQKSGAPVSEAAKAYLAAFREKPKMVKYIQTKWTGGPKRDWLSWHIRFARNAASELIKGTEPNYDPALHASVLSRLVGHNRRLLRSRIHRKYFQTFDEAQLESMKYIYFPMHKEPELALRFQATAWHDQRNTIQVLASCLPSGYRLLVREHRLNFGTRPAEYYRRLRRLPNVTLIDAFDSQYKYIRHADLVVTENGTSGWEGLILSRRVITLARTLYDGAGLTNHVRDPDHLGAKILQILERPAVVDPVIGERNLGYMVDAEFESTFLMSPEGTEAAVEHLARTIADISGVRRPATAAAVC